MNVVAVPLTVVSPTDADGFAALPPPGVAQVLSPRRKVVLLGVPLPSRTVGTMPVVSWLAFRLVRLAPMPLNDVAPHAPVAVTLNFRALPTCKSISEPVKEFAAL